MRTQLGAGETVVLRWQDCWSAGRTIEGQVRATGPGRVDLLLFPLYVPIGMAAKEDPALVPHMIFDRRSPRIPLDREGHYRIGRDEALPWIIAVCVADSQYGSLPDVNALRVLDTLLPGESADIPTGSVELRWKGSPRADPVWVSYEVPAESLRHPLSTAFGTARARWATGATLRLDGIPMRTRLLHVHDRLLPLELEMGRVVSVDVDFEALARPAK
jgi:hypothetical protein